MKKQYLIRFLSVLLAFTLACPTAYAAFWTKAASDNETAIFTYLTGAMGLNNAAACGVLANIEVESNFNPRAGGDGGSSYGICQWHASRYTRLKNYCYNRGLDYTTLYGQLCYLNFELENYYPGLLEKLRGVENTAGGAYNAGYYWCYYFEVPRGYASGVSDARGARAMADYWPVYAPAPEPTPTEKAAAFSASNPGMFLRMLSRMTEVLRTIFSLITAKKG